MSDKGSLSVFPNPVSEKITLAIPGSLNTSVSSVFIYGIDGREMIRQKIQGPKSEINVKSLPAGLYFIRLIWDERIESGKFVKN